MQDTSDNGGNWAMEYENGFIGMAMNEALPSNRLKNIVHGRIGREILGGFEDLVENGHLDISDAITSVIKSYVMAISAISHDIASPGNDTSLLRLLGKRTSDYADNLAKHIKKVRNKEDGDGGDRELEDAA